MSRRVALCHSPQCVSTLQARRDDTVITTAKTSSHEKYTQYVPEGNKTIASVSQQLDISQRADINVISPIVLLRDPLEMIVGNFFHFSRRDEKCSAK